MRRWQITYAGVTWVDEEITVAQAGAVAELCGDSWESMNPWSGPRVLACWLIALLAPVTGLSGTASFEAAASVVYDLKLSVLMDCISEPPALSAVA